MRTAIIIERAKEDYEGASCEYIVFNADAYEPAFKISFVSAKDRHMTLEAAKNAAYGEGYRAYKYKEKIFTFRQSRHKKKYEEENL